MADVLIMPRQGNTVESCVLVAWKVAEGASVAADEVVCEVETDKATFEVAAGRAGVLLKILRPAGDDVPVLEPIAVIGQRGEDWTVALPGAQAVMPVGPTAGEAGSPGTATPAGRAPPLAAASAVPAGGPAKAQRVSPRARRFAREQGVATAELAGTGPGGRVIERDVQSAVAARPLPTAAARAAAAQGAPVPSAGSAPGATRPTAVRPGAAASRDGFVDAPLKSIRKIIAGRMRASLATTAQLTFNGSAPAARLSALRARFKASEPALGLSEITIGDLVLFAVSRVIPRFPAMNSHLLDGTLRTFERVHLGLAVDTPRGLMVPVIRNADLLSLSELSAESKRLGAACNGGAISPDELAGSTFTVSNLGAFGVESFTPVLNAPEVGILGVDAIAQRVAAGPGGAPVLEPRIGLSLTVDHQVVDGVPAARVLKAIADAIGDIDLILACGHVELGAK